jgi:hypothetical protein
MPVQSDVPIGVGPLTDWGLWGPAAVNKVQAVSVHDGDDSVIYAASGGRLVREAMEFPTLSGVTDPVNVAAITCFAREYAKGGGGRGFFAMWNSNVVGANREAEVHVANPNYVGVNCPVVGADLALAAVNGYHGFQFSAAGGPSNMAEFWISQMYRTVDYTYLAGAAGEFAYHIASLVGAFIGGNLLFREMPALSRFIWRRAGYLIKPSEYEIAYRAWKEAPCH